MTNDGNFNADNGKWMVSPNDCDEYGYCVACGTATIHMDGCIVAEGLNLRARTRRD